jgi:acylphosphatase
MDIKKKIIISGKKVHDIGYRPYLLGIAESMEIERFFVDNTFSDEKQVVYALINSSEEKVDSFIEIASSKFPEKSIVEKVEVEDYKGNVMKIESFYRYLTAMQLSKIANYGEKMLDKQDTTIQVLQDVKHDTSAMLDKQDFHIEITRNGFNDIKDEIREMRSNMNAGFDSIKEEVHMQRDDFKEVFMKEVEGLHDEINEIRATLARMQHGQEV